MIYLHGLIFGRGSRLRVPGLAIRIPAKEGDPMINVFDQHAVEEISNCLFDTDRGFKTLQEILEKSR